jgi:hypothetical protein
MSEKSGTICSTVNAILSHKLKKNKKCNYNYRLAPYFSDICIVRQCAVPPNGRVTGFEFDSWGSLYWQWY